MESLLSITLTLCCILVALRLSSTQLDLTVVPGTSGTAVTTAAIDRMLIFGVFPSDNRLLRRVAYVETRDGVDVNTYRCVCVCVCEVGGGGGGMGACMCIACV